MVALVAGKYLGRNVRTWKDRDYYKFSILQNAVDVVQFDCSRETYDMLAEAPELCKVQVISDIFANSNSKGAYLSARCRDVSRVKGVGMEGEE